MALPADFTPTLPVTQEIVIDPEFKALIPPLDNDEYSKLEASILTEGCRDALIVWSRPLTFLNGDGPHELILIDGHHRHEICTRHNIPYRINEREFDSREAVIVWMVKNQLARRNLSSFVRSELVLKMDGAFSEMARKRQATSTGGKDPQLVEIFPQAENSRVRDELGKVAEVSGRTLAKVETVLEDAPEVIKERARSGDISIDRAYKLTKALEHAQPNTISAVERFELDDVDTITELERMSHQAQDSYYELVGSGYMQFGDEHEAIPITAGALKLKEGLILKSQMHMAEKRKIDIVEAQTLPDQVFNVVYADPPWQYDNAIESWGPARLHYDDLELDDILKFPETIALQIHEKAVLFLWATNPFLPAALQVMEAWGFNYKTNIAWVKTELQKPGTGFYVRGRHELLLIGTRGSFIPLDTHISPPIGSVIEAPLQEHSVKPDEVYDIIERLYPDCNYVELFARRERQGWTSHGNQII